MLQTEYNRIPHTCVTDTYVEETLVDLDCYIVFHQFGQAKFDKGGSILSSSQFLLLPQLLQKNEARYKSGQNWLKTHWLANNDLNPWNTLYYSIPLTLTSEKQIFLSNMLRKSCANVKIFIIFFSINLMCFLTFEKRCQ